MFLLSAGPPARREGERLHTCVRAIYFSAARTSTHCVVCSMAVLVDQTAVLAPTPLHITIIKVYPIDSGQEGAS